MGFGFASVSMGRCFDFATMGLGLVLATLGPFFFAVAGLDFAHLGLDPVDACGRSAVFAVFLINISPSGLSSNMRCCCFWRFRRSRFLMLRF
jgi:hypothetical protein